jgi:hypothetical protein
MPSRRATLHRTLAAALLAAACGRAAASGLDLQLEPGVFAEEFDQRDQSGATTHRSTLAFSQRYHLLADRELFPNVHLSAGGTWQDLTAHVKEPGQEERTTGNTSEDLFARLGWGSPILRGTLGADRHAQEFRPGTSRTTDRLSFSAGWRPVELPELSLLVTRLHDYASDRSLGDATLTSALVTALYTVHHVDTRYTFSWADRDDVAGAVHTVALDQSLQASWRETFFGGRTRVYAAATGSWRELQTSYGLASALVARQQFPIAGLSLVETPPWLPLDELLSPNPALIDGDLKGMALLDIGFGVTLAGDLNPRAMGAQLADRATTVSRIDVYVDKLLPTDVAAKYSWSAYQSDDGQHWTPLPPPAVAFDPHQRFEISIEPTRARYLKVITAPLAAGITADLRWLAVHVTELQLQDVVPASTLPKVQTSRIASLHASATTALLEGPRSLVHDLSLELSYVSSTALRTWAVTNGLTYAEKLGKVFEAGARAAHRDEDPGDGHQGTTLWSATLLARPVPTLYDALSYSGTYAEKTNTVTNAVNFVNRAELYRGVNAQLNLGLTQATFVDGHYTVGTLANAVASIVPNRVLSATASWLLNVVRTFGTLEPIPNAVTHRVEVTATFTPSAAVAASGTLTRVISGLHPTTLASGQLTYAPFRGDLQLSLAASRTLDTVAQSTNGLLSPSLRWLVRRGVTVTASYSLLDVSSPVQTTRSQVISASLMVAL